MNIADEIELTLKETAYQIAYAMVAAEFSVTAELMKQPTLADALQLMNETYSAVPTAVDDERQYREHEARDTAAERGYSEEETREYVHVRLSSIPAVATIRSRLDSARRTAFSRWRNGKAAVLPMWWDESLTMSLVDDVYQWVPFVPRNQDAINKKKAEKQAEKQAEIDKAADVKAAALLNDADAVQKAADDKAANMVKAAVQAAETQKAAAIKATAEKADVTAELAKVRAERDELRQKAAELQTAVDRLTSVNRVLTAAVQDERVIQQAAEILAGKAAAGMI